MIYAWIDGQKRPPRARGERALCRDCGSDLFAVVPADSIAHWRHRAGDCDTWSELESGWHLAWKECFDTRFREVPLKDPATGELHRAAILCRPAETESTEGGTAAREAVAGTATVLELQHSPISEEEREARETFYLPRHQMFRLVHLHNGQSLAGANFGLSLNFSRPVEHKSRRFFRMHWIGRSHQFIEKWKRSRAHVFFDWQGELFYLDNSRLRQPVQCLGQGRIRAEPAVQGRVHRGGVWPTGLNRA